MSGKKTKDVQLFSQELASWGNGSVDEYLAENMLELVTAIKETQQKGSIVITVNLDPIIEGEGAAATVFAVDIKPAITVKIPRPVQSMSRRYPNEANELERVDPRTPDMFPLDVL